MSKQLNQQLRDAYIAGCFNSFYLYKHLVRTVQHCQKIVNYTAMNSPTTNRSLANFLGLSAKSVDRYCSSLVKLGILQVELVRIKGKPIPVKHYYPNTRMI